MNGFCAPSYKKLKDIKPVIIFKDYIWIEEKHKALKYEKVN